MNVLWVTNLIFPCLADKLHLNSGTSGGWLYHFAKLLSQREDVNLGIVTIYPGKEYKVIRHDEITFLILPVSKFRKIIGSKNRKDMNNIERDFPPDLIHIHGTELPLGLCFIHHFIHTKIVLNIQTLACRMEEEMDGGIRFMRRIRHLSLRECLSLKFHFMRKIYARIRSRKEKKYLQSVKYVIGSTPWDMAYIKNKYPDIIYYSCQYLFREAFYQEDKWNIDNAEPNSILTGQAVAPLKGLHILIKALYFVKKEISDVKLYIPGPNLTSKYYLQRYSYAKLIKGFIIKYKLIDNVIFTGNLNEEEMAHRMKISQIVVVPSAIELGSSMLCEAMLLGVPIIASYRGGMTEKFQHGISGFYYDYPEVYMLAEYIKKLLKDKKMASEISQNEIIIAQREHDQERCCQKFCDTYWQIIKDEGAGYE